MHLIHRRDVIRSARDRWLKQYERTPDSSIPMWARDRTYGDLRAALRDLDLETCSSEDVDAALGGSTGWGNNDCDECRTNCETLVHFGSEPDYEVQWQDLCGDCLKRGIDVLLQSSHRE